MAGIEEVDAYPRIELAWVHDGIQLMPRWSKEPSVAAIIETLRMSEMLPKSVGTLGKSVTDMDYAVHHMWDGTYNKFYSVEFDGRSYVLKLTPPVAPGTKTESEVATLQWTSKRTNLPVPRVIGYSSTSNNPIGCEWILMTKIEGTPLSECGLEMIPNMPRTVRMLAEYASQAFEVQCTRICNLYPPKPEKPDGGPRVGEVVSMPFFWGERATVERDDPGLHRGPFTTNKEWTRQRLLRHRWEAGTKSELSVWMKRSAIESLEHLHDRLFPEANEGEPEATMLWHDNLSLDNIFVDENGIITGILDWECVGFIPLAEACQRPAFLQEGRRRDEVPSERQRPFADPNLERLRTVFWKLVAEEPEEPTRSSGAELIEATLLRHERLKLTEFIPEASLWLRVPKVGWVVAGGQKEGDKTVRMELVEKPNRYKMSWNGNRRRRRRLEASMAEEAMEVDEDGADDEGADDEDAEEEGVDEDGGPSGSQNESEEDPLAEEEDERLRKSAMNKSRRPSAVEKTVEAADEPARVPATEMAVGPDEVQPPNDEAERGEEDKTRKKRAPKRKREPPEPPKPYGKTEHYSNVRTREELLDTLKQEPSLPGLFHEPRRRHLARLRDYDLSRLRELFVDEMRWRSPGWVAVFGGAQTRRDYEAAVQNCDNDAAVPAVLDWIDDVEAALGEGREPRAPWVPSLAEELLQGPSWDG